MTQIIPINESAVEEFRAFLPTRTRVLVSGGTGWFGRTSLAMMREAPAELHIVASKPRRFTVDGVQYQAHSWDEKAIAEFAPELYLDFAFTTVNHAEALGLEHFNELNKLMLERLQVIAGLPSVRRLLYVSSGAAVRLPQRMEGNEAAVAYARKKQEAEILLAELAEVNNMSVGIARAWSVSGGHVRYPKDYALSSMAIEGLRHGSIQIKADRPVFRRYAAVEDLIALTAAKMAPETIAIVDSGGPLIEIGELAKAILRCIGDGNVSEIHSTRSSKAGDFYFSTTLEWDEMVAKTRMTPISLTGQIENVISAMRVR